MTENTTPHTTTVNELKATPFQLKHPIAAGVRESIVLVVGMLLFFFENAFHDHPRFLRS
jgi:hypothetical protein